MSNTTIPQSVLGKLEFFEERLAVWSADPTAIGIEATDIVSLNTMVTNARAAYENARASRNTAKADTIIQNLAIADMYGFGSDLVKTMRAFALKTNDPSVYSAAQIPPPAPPSPVGPPDQPTELAASVLLPFGIRLTWKGSVANGAYFGIFRKLHGETSYSIIKTTAEKSYSDTALPVGVTSVDYYIAAMRDAFQVNSSSLQVRFGPEGATTTTLAMAA